MAELNIDRKLLHFRNCLIDLKNKRVLIARIQDSEQEKDLTKPPNCNGYGRVRHFRRLIGKEWPNDPLPIDPACKALGLASVNILKTQVFQNAVCNWQCWYCFVPIELRVGGLRFAKWFTPAELIDLYLSECGASPVIDLSGGQPELAPEWVVWMMNEIRKRGIENKIYLWSDDNLSTDYFWRFLSQAEQEIVVNYANYGKVGCFKGYDKMSFGFNTGASPELFDRQFEIMAKLIKLGIDQYAYVTLTTPSLIGIEDAIKRFIERLQSIDGKLPLRTVPLQIAVFKTVKRRMNKDYKKAIENQFVAVEIWNSELRRNYSDSELILNIADVRLRNS